MEDKRNPGAIDYFHRRIKDFDDIYREDKKGLLYFLNKTIRASVGIRFKLAFDILGDLSGKSILDIGCGSGRYMFKAVEKNASSVIGIDAAEGAIEEAKNIASELGVEDRLEFIVNDFMDIDFNRKFNVLFAVGYFDYIFNSEDHLRKMLELSDGIIYASFPKFWSPLSWIRKIRLALNGCPVKYYTGPRVKKLMKKIGVSNYELKPIFRDYILIIKK